MSKSQRIIFFAISGFVGLPVIIAVTLLFFVNANAYKPRLEAAASDALGMEVRVGGKMGIGFSPGLLITLDDLHIRNRGADLVSAKEAMLGIDLFPLLHNEVRIGQIILKHPSVFIGRNSDGKFNFETTQTTGTLPALDLARISVTDGSLLYADKQSGEGFEAGASQAGPAPSSANAGENQGHNQESFLHGTTRLRQDPDQGRCLVRLEIRSRGQGRRL